MTDWQCKEICDATAPRPVNSLETKSHHSWWCSMQWADFVRTANVHVLPPVPHSRYRVVRRKVFNTMFVSLFDIHGFGSSPSMRVGSPGGALSNTGGLVSSTRELDGCARRRTANKQTSIARLATISVNFLSSIIKSQLTTYAITYNMAAAKEKSGPLAFLKVCLAVAFAKEV